MRILLYSSHMKKFNPKEVLGNRSYEGDEIMEIQNYKSNSSDLNGPTSQSLTPLNHQSYSEALTNIYKDKNPIANRIYNCRHINISTNDKNQSKTDQNQQKCDKKTRNGLKENNTGNLGELSLTNYKLLCLKM